MPKDDQKSEASPARQLTFAAIESLLQAQGLSTLPEGFSDLTRREANFVCHLLRHGNQARAAIEAGYSAESARAIASETLRKPDVFRFYQKCLEPLANSGEQLVKRVYERSAMLHAKAMEAAQSIRDGDELVRLSVSIDTGSKFPGAKTQWDTKREQTVKAEKHYLTLANQTDTLLASLLGKLNLNVTGEVAHNHVVLNEGLRNDLIEQRRRLQESRKEWSIGGIVHARN